MSERYVLEVSPALSLDREQPPMMNRVLSLPVSAADDEQFVPVGGAGGFRYGDGKGRKLFYGAVRFNQQGVFQDALSIVASGHSQPLAHAGKGGVTQRDGQCSRLAPLAVAKLENILVVGFGAAFLRS
mgnify:CR=1 FL=1